MGNIPYEIYNGRPKRLYLTGKWKIHKAPMRHSIHYVQAQVYFLGIPLWRRWVNKLMIEWREEKVEACCGCETKDNSNYQLNEAHKTMFRRYIEIISANPEIEDEEFLIKFCETGKYLENTDKQSRWVGYIQGILIERGYATVEEERNFSRKIYRPVYEKLGWETKTVEIT